MKIISTVADLEQVLSKISASNSVGFVPTMGALHQGHLNLVKKAIDENQICICSIFVNPTQFNNKEDLEKYPNRIESDLKLLEEVGCDIVFTPTKVEIYPANFKPNKYNFNTLDKVMEGANRPGHFDGVAMVVARLFDIVKPQKAYFGEKDFQQLAIIRSLVKQDNRPIQIVACPISREKDGLAMSSRNLRLEERYRKAAPRIYQRLQELNLQKDKKSPNQIREWMTKEFENDCDLELEYFEISDEISLKKSSEWIDYQKHIACIAVYAGAIRLIDNILLDIN